MKIVTFCINAFGDVIVGRHSDESFWSMYGMIRMSHKQIFDCRSGGHEILVYAPVSPTAKSDAAATRVRDWLAPSFQES